MLWISSILCVIAIASSALLAGSYKTVSGTYRDTIVGGASNTCDSIVVTSLTVSPENIGDTTVLTACDSTVWGGTTYTATGFYNDTLPSASGCDSIVTLNLTITPTEDATFAYGSSSYCASATDPTPTVSGVSGGAFSSTTGLVINSSTGAID